MAALAPAPRLRFHLPFWQMPLSAIEAAANCLKAVGAQPLLHHRGPEQTSVAQPRSQADICCTADCRCCGLHRHGAPLASSLQAIHSNSCAKGAAAAGLQLLVRGLAHSLCHCPAACAPLNADFLQAAHLEEEHTAAMAALLKELATVRCKDHEVRCWCWCCSAVLWPVRLHKCTQLSGVGAGTMAAADAAPQQVLEAIQVYT